MSDGSIPAEAFDRFLDEQRRHFANLEGQVERLSAKVDDLGRRTARSEVISEDWTDQRRVLFQKIDDMRTTLEGGITSLRMASAEKDAEIRRTIRDEDQAIRNEMNQVREQLEKEIRAVALDFTILRTRAAMAGAMVGAIVSGLFTVAWAYLQRRLGW